LVRGWSCDVHRVGPLFLAILYHHHLKKHKIKNIAVRQVGPFYFKTRIHIKKIKLKN
jgi:hypothetical protein